MPKPQEIAALLLFSLLASSCSFSAKKPVQMQPLDRAQGEVRRAEDVVEAVERKWPGDDAATRQSHFRKEGLTLLIQADPQLNRYQRNAHTLFLCLYQLKEPNGFTQLAQERDGLQKLLECTRFDGSVANARQYVIQPGQRLNEMRDRSEGARYLGVATGYFGSGKEKVTDLANLSPTGGYSATTISIELGPHEITSVKVK